MMGDVSQNSFLLSPTHSIIESVNQNQLVNRQNLCTSDCSLLTRTFTSVLATSGIMSVAQLTLTRPLHKRSTLGKLHCHPGHLIHQIEWCLR